MDLKKLQTLDSLMPQQPPKLKDNGVAGAGPTFKDTLNGSLGQVGGAGQIPTLDKMTGTGAVSGVIPKRIGTQATDVKFSNHAVDRMRTRGISYSPDDIAKINDAVSRAAAKGSKDSLILMNDSALIVSVKNNTVVTVMDKNALKENVFTNIDSTIVM